MRVCMCVAIYYILCICRVQSPGVMNNLYCIFLNLFADLSPPTTMQQIHRVYCATVAYGRCRLYVVAIQMTCQFLSNAHRMNIVYIAKCFIQSAWSDIMSALTLSQCISFE